MSEVLKLNHEEVMKIIPHRDPILLIDEVSELVPGEEIRASYRIDPDKEIFKGHFPGDPLSVRIQIRYCRILLMTKPAYAGKVPLFLGINNVKFKKKVLPGDTLEIHAKLASERAEKAIATCKCEAYVGGEWVGALPSQKRCRSSSPSGKSRRQRRRSPGRGAVSWRRWPVTG